MAKPEGHHLIVGFVEPQVQGQCAVEHSINYVSGEFVGYQYLRNLSSVPGVAEKQVEASKTKFGLGVVVVSHVDIFHILTDVVLHELVLLDHHAAVELHEPIHQRDLHQVVRID